MLVLRGHRRRLCRLFGGRALARSIARPGGDRRGELLSVFGRRQTV